MKKPPKLSFLQLETRDTPAVLQWSGLYSGDLEDPGNWVPRQKPVGADTLKFSAQAIPNNTVNAPVVPASATLVYTKLLVDGDWTGQTITVNGTLKFAQSSLDSNLLNIEGDGSIEFNGQDGGNDWTRGNVAVKTVDINTTVNIGFNFSHIGASSVAGSTTKVDVNGVVNFNGGDKYIGDTFEVNETGKVFILGSTTLRGTRTLLPADSFASQVTNYGRVEVSAGKDFGLNHAYIRNIDLQVGDNRIAKVVLNANSSLYETHIGTTYTGAGYTQAGSDAVTEMYSGSSLTTAGGDITINDGNFNLLGEGTYTKNGMNYNSSYTINAGIMGPGGTIFIRGHSRFGFVDYTQDGSTNVKNAGSTLNLYGNLYVYEDATLKTRVRGTMYMDHIMVSGNTNISGTPSLPRIAVQIQLLDSGNAMVDAMDRMMMDGLFQYYFISTSGTLTAPTSPLFFTTEQAGWGGNTSKNGNLVRFMLTEPN